MSESVAPKNRVQVPVPIEVIPEEYHARVGPGAPRPLRLALARAALPMEPSVLLIALAYLAQDEDEEIAQAAHESAVSLPESIVGETLSNPQLSSQVLDYYARYFLDDDRYQEALILNPATPDDAVAYIGGETGAGRWIDMIALNQVRFLRSPRIIESIYYNPEAKMSAIARMIETAARSGLDLGHIPGFREVQASILGQEELKNKRDAGELTKEEFDGLMEELEVEDEGLDDDAFQRALKGAMEELDGSSVADAEEEEEAKEPLWKSISKMKAAQKIRLALMGNGSARKILIRDPKKIVCMAVLRSPRITDKEISFFATQKAISEDVIRAIAVNREWTRRYSTKLALVKNPKTPPQQSMFFLKSLVMSDLRHIAKDRDVPGLIQRSAKQLMEQKRGGKKR